MGETASAASQARVELEVGIDRAVDYLVPFVRELHQDTSTVVSVRQPPDQSGLLHAIDSACHAAGREKD
jgi:hypothetical protein